MKPITSRLIADGSTDRALLPVIDWTLAQHVQPGMFENAEWAELRRVKNPPRTLRERLTRALVLYPCDLLFVHRDAEKQPLNDRIAEIEQAASEIAVPYVCVVPMRMQEAWLLFDEQAIRDAAGNPNGRNRLSLPELRCIESLADPKKMLHDLLTQAAGLNARRSKQFNADRAQQNIPLQISDFSPLRQLSADQHFESNLRQILRQDFPGNMKPDSPTA